MNYEKQLNYPNKASVGNLQTQFNERLSGLLDRYNDLCNGPVYTRRANQLGGCSKHVTRAVVSNSWVQWYLCGVVASLPIRGVLVVTVSYVDTKYSLYCAMPHVCIVAYQYIVVTPVLTGIASCGTHFQNSLPQCYAHSSYTCHFHTTAM